jgi:ABC-type Fe3+-siderophore transport system permease subunit
MSDAEIERIFRSLDRIEARLLKLEEREAMRRGSDMTKTQLVVIIGAISAATGAATAIITQII